MVMTSDNARFATYFLNTLWFGAAGYTFTEKAIPFSIRNSGPVIRSIFKHNLDREMLEKASKIANPLSLSSSSPSSSQVVSFNKHFLLESTVYATRFLGGMNQGFSLLSFLRLVLYLKKREWEDGEWTLFLSCGLAHFTQFFFNVSMFSKVFLGGETLASPVAFTKEMLFIFITDFLIAFLNFYVCFLSFKNKRKEKGEITHQK